VVSGGGGLYNFYFKEKCMNSTDCMPWGLQPRIKSAVRDLGPTEVQKEGKGSVVLPKFFLGKPRKWSTESLCLWFMNSGVAYKAAQVLVFPHN